MSTGDHVLFPTTTVGSFPKPDYLKKARTQHQKGAIDDRELERLERKATEDWIRLQEEIGIDILVDGEMYRGDMAAYFADRLDGFETSGLVRSYGNRFYKKPIAKREIRFRDPITVEWWRFAQGLTDKPVKGILTGPYTMMDWSFNEAYPDRKALTIALAHALRSEVDALVEAGCKYVQIDEPAVSTRPEELEIAIEAMGICTEGLPDDVKTITHICYGDFAAIYPDMLRIPVDQFDLEMSNSELDMLGLFGKSPFTKEIAFGAVDVHSHALESVEDVKRRVRAALEVIPAERVTIDPDCGLKTRTQDETVEKLKVIVQAARELREEVGGDSGRPTKAARARQSSR
jgi:5-methyltetrahydropteroyltriglutamate--homocysteine methyltransferase